MNRLESIAEKVDGLKLPDIDFDNYLKENQTDNQKIKRVVDYFDEIEHHIEHGEEMSGSKTPFTKLNNLFGFRRGEVTMWTGYNGHKKSMLLGFFAINFLRYGEKVCIASFEMKPVSTISRMTRQFCNSSKNGYDEFSSFMEFAGNNFYIFDHLGGINPSRLFGVIVYCAKELGVKHFMIDSLMRVVAGEDKYNEQKDFVVKLCEIAIQYDIHIHLVHHVRDGDESKPSNRYSAKGSKAISDNVSNSLIVWSNKEKDKDMPDAILKCDKQRQGEWEGSIALNFDNVSLNFSEAHNGY